jgi:AraC-like DNA-binding protein
MSNELAPEIAPPMTVSTVLVRGMLAAIEAKGIPFESWLFEVGLSPQLLSSDEARITLDQYGRLLQTLMQRLDDEMLGFLSRPLKGGSFALLVRSAIRAATLEGAIRHLAHTFRLLNDDLTLRLIVEDTLAGVVLDFSNSAPAAYPFLHETLLRVYWCLFAWLAGGRLPLVRFDFAYPRPSYAAAYASIFPAPWLFEAECSGMWFAKSYLRMPVVRDEQAARGFVAGAPANIIVPTRDSGLAGAVRMHLRLTQPQWPDLEQTARALNVSASTLQRHLAAAHTSFQAVRDEVRRDLAIYRLTTSAVSLAKLAGELGFADGASFQRAFKRWTGYAPGLYRGLGRPTHSGSERD